MRLSNTADFERERKRFDFSFTCEGCAYFSGRDERCRHGYPPAEHRLARYEPPNEAKEIVFCKEFELD
jgi:hypothetical protein